MVNLSFTTARALNKMSSPSITTLPEELLLEIFHFRASHPPFQYPISLGSRDLSQVCQLWRRLLLASPYLWSFIHIHSGANNHWLSQLSMWLERSRDWPLTLSVCITTTYMSSYTTTLLEQVFEFLVPHSRRWSVVNFQCPRPPDYWGVGLNRVEALEKDIDLPRVQRVVLKDFTYLPRCFRNCPALLSFHSDNSLVFPRENNGLLSSFMHHFRELTLVNSQSQPQDIVQCLTLLPHLTYLRMHANGSDRGSFIGPVTIIRLPNLLTLDIPSCGILPFLECPNLRTLHLHCRNDSEGPVPELPEFLYRTSSLHCVQLDPQWNRRAFHWMLHPTISTSRLLQLHIVFPNSSTYALPNLDDHVVLPFLYCITVTFTPPHNGAKWPLQFVDWIVKSLPCNYQDRSHGLHRTCPFPSLERVNVEVAIWGHQRDGVEDVKRQWVDLQKSAPKGTMDLALSGGLTDIRGELTVPIWNMDV
ncbi:hypothetical protein DL96DRAFT_1637799 [Flagelloscypha sp. PMI_526]|nr:hypothetical protein DL96DRAFT_1637799 [Flagelloscypha sp. PMI_526]